MKIHVVIATTLIFLNLHARAQEGLASIYDQQPDRILMSTDRHIYIAGDSIWYSVKILAGHSPSISSTILYTELWDSRGQLIDQKVQPIRQGHSEGFLSIQQDAVGPLLIRAYTDPKQDPTGKSLFQQTIPLFEKQSSPAAAPAAEALPVQIQINPAENFALFTLLRDQATKPEEVYSLAAFLNRQLIYKVPVDMREEPVLGGRIPMPANASGRLEVLLMNKEDLLGYQHLESSNAELIEKVKVNAGKDTKRKQPSIEIAWNDSLPIQFSISVTNPALQNWHSNTETQANIQFWKNVLKNQVAGTSVDTSTFIRWTAQLSPALTKRYRNKQLVLLIKPVDQELQYHTVTINNEGRFSLDGLQYHDSAAIYYSEIGKKNVIALTKKDIVVIDNLINPGEKPAAPALPFPPVLWDGETSSKSRAALQSHAALKDPNRMIELEEVKVTGSKKSERALLDERLAKGPFARQEGADIVLPDDDPAFLSSMSILHYLQGRVPGMDIDPNALEDAVNWRGSTTALFIDEISQSIMGDGVPVEDARRITAIPMSDIAMVKIFPPPFLGAWGNGAGGAIAVYQKHGADRRNSLPPAKPIVRGFSAPGYFYNNPDNSSLTIYWNPQLIMQDKEKLARIHLPASLSGRQVRVQLLGLRTDGQIIRKDLWVDLP